MRYKNIKLSNQTLTWLHRLAGSAYMGKFFFFSAHANILSGRQRRALERPSCKTSDEANLCLVQAFGSKQKKTMIMCDERYKSIRFRKQDNKFHTCEYETLSLTKTNVERTMQ